MPNIGTNPYAAGSEESKAWSAQFGGRPILMPDMNNGQTVAQLAEKAGVTQAQVMGQNENQNPDTLVGGAVMNAQQKAQVLQANKPSQTAPQRPVVTPDGAASTAKTFAGGEIAYGGIGSPVYKNGIAVGSVDASGNIQYSAAQNPRSLIDQLKPKTQEEIRQEQLAQAQSLIDATEGSYRDQLARIQQRGQENLNQTSSIAVGAGLAASPFSQAMERRTTAATAQEQTAAENQRRAEVARAKAEAMGRATEIYDKQIAQYQQERQYVNSQEEKARNDQAAQVQAARSAALAIVSNLAKGGVSLSELDPTERQKLAAGGLSDFEMNAIWNANNPASGGKTEIQGNNIVTYYMDPKTGKPVISTTELPKELQALKAAQGTDLQEVTTADGVYIYDKKAGLQSDGTVKMFRVGARTPTAAELNANNSGASTVGAGTAKPLSADASKVLGYAESMPTEGEQLKAILANADRAQLLAILSGADTATSRLIDSFADKVGRLRSGGAINKDEIASFKGQLIRKADLLTGDTSSAINSIDTILGEAKNVVSSIRGGKWVPGLKEDAMTNADGTTSTGTGTKDALDNALDSSGSGFKKVGSVTVNAQPENTGALSQKYESGGNPAAIGYDSTGGYSYGKYQLAHNNAQRFVQQSPYAGQFAGLAFNSPEFRARWKEVAQKDPQGFGEAQRRYIEQTHFAPQLSKLASAGIDVSKLSPTLRDVIWSTAVQHGANTDVVQNAIKQAGPNAKEADIVNAIYNERWSGGRRFASSTPAVKNAVKRRLDNERRDALATIA